MLQEATTVCHFPFPKRCFCWVALLFFHPCLVSGDCNGLKRTTQYLQVLDLRIGAIN